MHRSLKPSGKLLVSVYSERAREAQLEWYKMHGLHVVCDAPDYMKVAEGFKSERFSREKLQELAKLAGLETSVHQLSPIGLMAVFEKRAPKGL